MEAFDLQPRPPECRQQRCQLCSTRHLQENTPDKHGHEHRERTIMVKPADPYSDEGVRAFVRACVRVRAFSGLVRAAPQSLLSRDSSI